MTLYGRPSFRAWIVLMVLIVATTTVLVACGGQQPAPTATAPADADSDTGGETMGDVGGMAMQPLGETSWEGMKISLASSPPTRHTVFQGSESREITPTPEDSMHLMVVLADEETGERIPYSSVWVTIEDSDGQVVFDERLWPMISRGMGTHYGINVPLPEPGTYQASVQVGPPQVARHPEYTDRWQEPHTFETKITWEGQQ